MANSLSGLARSLRIVTGASWSWGAQRDEEEAVQREVERIAALLPPDHGIVRDGRAQGASPQPGTRSPSQIPFSPMQAPRRAPQPRPSPPTARPRTAHPRPPPELKRSEEQRHLQGLPRDSLQRQPRPRTQPPPQPHAPSPAQPRSGRQRQSQTSRQQRPWVASARTRAPRRREGGHGALRAK